MYPCDVQCDSGLGAYRLYELIYQEADQKVAIMMMMMTMMMMLML